MSSLKQILSRRLGDAFAAAGCDREHGQVSDSGRPDLAQFQCNGAMAAAKQRGAKPREVAQRVVETLHAAPDAEAVFRQIDIAGPGFINLSLTDAALAAHVTAVAGDPMLGCDPPQEPLKIFVDYGGPNIAKPMHVGHLRSSIIGDSVKRIARFAGHVVVGDVHLGDWGLQMGMLIAELARRQPELPYFDASKTIGFPEQSPVTIEDLQRLYPESSRRAKTDDDAMAAARTATRDLQAGRPGYRALWRHFVDMSVAELRADFAALDIEFDLWLGESDVSDAIPPLLDRLRREGLAVMSEGAEIIDVAEPGDKRELPPLILVKSDGAVLYGTTDLATIEQRVDEGADLVLYVVDNRQSDHFVQVFRAARKAGIAPPNVGLEHVGHGTMNGNDGKPFKTREGGVMRLKDLIEIVTSKARERMAEAEVAIDYGEDEKESIAKDVGIAALKYADLMNHRTKDYVFDLERFSAFEGRTGPYLLYAAVRIKSILRNAEARGVMAGELIAPESAAERDLLLELSSFPDAVAAALDARAPNALADFAFRLATSLSRFYAEHHILREPDSVKQASWLTLMGCTAAVLEQSLELLGLRVPERM
ncbi:MAG TPA: arginine--tRNA ligase [Gammaproteobacteria bacterium]|nr:arginine--tRNA ligase [Gammaproteobacteria bacterium]